MASRYVEGAIDHGTTNSAIAIMHSSGPRVIKHEAGDDIMPSAVYVTRRGEVLVGRRAVNAMVANKPEEGDGHTGYKPCIGQDGRYNFNASGKNMTAPQLGALVMGQLLRTYQEEMKKELRACVITVPAKFDQPACEGTRKAAEEAGLLFYPLLQEPIAAALAYGFTAQQDRAYWMVFDLGGGTLDVSLVMVRNGQIVVPKEGHAGDNNLGGRKFDRELLDYVLGQLSKKYSLKKFSSTNPEYAMAWSKLLLAVENAKIGLTTRETAVVMVDGVLCKDDRGRAVEVDVPVDRRSYESLIGPDVERAVGICESLLTRSRLKLKDIDRIILVGGPTKTPYIQKTLTRRLKIDLDTRIDPMTAVVQGAAMYATTVEIPEEVQKLMPEVGEAQGRYALTVKAERSSKQALTYVSGMIDGPAVEDGGFTVQIKRADGGWSSTPMSVEESGLFEVEVALLSTGKAELSCFTTTVFDRSGRAVASIDEPEIWFRLPEGETSLPSSIMVELAGNETYALLNQGSSLPCKGHGKFKTTKSLRKGSSEDVLRIPVREAIASVFGEEDPRADCNVHVGTLIIEGSDERVTMDLPEGVEVEITMDIDTSRVIRINAFIPILEEEFEARFTPDSYGMNLDEIAERFEELKKLFRETEELQRVKPTEEAGRAIALIKREDMIAGIEKELKRARAGESDAADRAHKRILGFAGGMNQLRRIQQVPRIERHIEELEPVCRGDELKDFQSIKAEFRQARASGDTQTLDRIETALDELDTQVRARPLIELLLDLLAIQEGAKRNKLDSRNVNERSVAVFKRAVDLHRRMEDKGGDKALTDRDIAQLEAMHDELMMTFHNLGALRQMFLEGLSKDGRSMSDVSRRVEGDLTTM